MVFEKKKGKKVKVVPFGKRYWILCTENVVWHSDSEKNFFPTKTLRVNKSSLGSPERDAHAAMLKKL